MKQTSKLLNHIQNDILSRSIKINFILFLCFAFITRISLIGTALAEKQIDFTLLDISQAIILGLLNDSITFFYIALTTEFLGFMFPDKIKSKIYIKSILYFIYIFSLCFLATGEITFWLEFQSRFNFIAVDYLVYTHEVIHNIVESYPLLEIFLSLFCLTSVILYQVILYIKKDNVENRSSRLYSFGLFISLSLAAFFLYDPKITDIKDNNYLTEISKNGLYNLFSAFRQNELDYYKFYSSISDAETEDELYPYLKGDNAEIDKKAFSRFIKSRGIQNDYNVFLITIESMSSEYLYENYNGTPLTPVLSKLKTQGLYFNKLYAAGTRTVRGLEALSLSIPPIPGQSILRRPHNENLFSIATVLKKENYDTKFIYGGYGYFDNMNYFFSNNGFDVIDRNDMSDSEIIFSNAWGVSDEDLYKEAIKQADKSYNNQKKFFSLVMTTSNHRPYTYPDNRIDIPSKSGRSGGVKYTDYALGQFLELAKTKPWFDKTIFVITADHCAGSAGKVGLPPKKYHIPLIIYAPHIIQPNVIDALSSQIDIAPTILGLLNISYESRFFGNDILDKKYQNAFISTFQKLGYIEGNNLVVLSPSKIIETYELKNEDIIKTSNDENLSKRAISYYQSAYRMYKTIDTKAASTKTDSNAQ